MASHPGADDHQERPACGHRARATHHAGRRGRDRRPGPGAVAAQPCGSSDDRLQRAVPVRRARPRRRHRRPSHPARVAALGDHHRSRCRRVATRHPGFRPPRRPRDDTAATTAPVTRSTGTRPTPSPTTSPAASRHDSPPRSCGPRTVLSGHAVARVVERHFARARSDGRLPKPFCWRGLGCVCRDTVVERYLAGRRRTTGVGTHRSPWMFAGTRAAPGLKLVARDGSARLRILLSSGSSRAGTVGWLCHRSVEGADACCQP
jgi:hypothetical protein